MRPRFGASVTIVGHVVLTVGICLILQPTWGDLGLAAQFGAVGCGTFDLAAELPVRSIVALE